MRWLHWHEIPRDTALGKIVAPYVGMDDENDVVLDGHLVGNGMIQLSNPGFDEHMIGIGAIPWFGWGNCALLAFYLHEKTGWPLVNLVFSDSAHADDPHSHTAVLSPDGEICDWQGVMEPDEAAAVYRDHSRTSLVEWVPIDKEDWMKIWISDGDPRPDRHFDAFELALTEYLADLLIAEASAPCRGA